MHRTTHNTQSATDNGQRTTDNGQRGHPPSSILHPPSSAVELRIEQLILHDLPIEQRHEIAAAIERELARLLAEQGLPRALAGRGENIPIDAAAATITPGARPDAIGAQVARSIYSSMAGDQHTRAETRR